MMVETVISRSVRLICAGGMVLGVSAAHAQEPVPAPAPEAQATEQLQRVEVTGSRIPTANLEGVSPVTVLNAEEIKMDGARSVENLLNNLPQVFADQGGTIANGASGTATVNLRNLGPDRTLVLINGRRVPAGSPRSTAADLNQIPAPLIKRVEVLTGGASAVYGSDAVAGVVNFIMNDRFEGAQIELNHSFYNHQQSHSKMQDALRASGQPIPDDKSADGKVSDASILLGANFDGGKGNATVFFSYKKEDALLQSERDYSACSIGGMTEGDTFACGGSSTSYPGRFRYRPIGSLITENYTVADAAGNVRPWDQVGDLYNFGPLNYFQRPSERYGFSAFTHYNVNDKATIYSEASFHDDHTIAQIAPSGLFSVATDVAYENPFLSDAWRSTLELAAPGDTSRVTILRRNVEGGGRQDDIRHTSYRGVLGLRGDVGNWSYDLYGQMGRVLYQEMYKNDFSIARSQRALDVITDPATGQPACRSAVDGTDPDCVPYNIWSLGQVAPEALTYLQTPGLQRGYTSQRVLGATLTTDLGEYGMKLPTANEGIGLSGGVEHRVEKLGLDVDTAFDTGDLAGQGGPTHGVAGEYSVKDYFIETRVPLMDDMPFAEDLSLSASYRRSEYSTDQSTSSYGLGLEWKPVEMLLLRASYQQAVRAANVVELFTPAGLGLYDNNRDPCAGPINKPNGTPNEKLAPFAQCALTGVTADQYGNIEDNTAQQYNAIFGGNTALEPETSKSRTFGVVLTPMKNLSLTLDYFNIKVEDVIGAMPPTTTLEQCMKGNQASCALIHRDVEGSLWLSNDAYIVANNRNLGMRKTSGLDVGLNYAMTLGEGYGGIDFGMTGTYLREFMSEDAPGTGEYDCAGLFGSTCGTPLPKWRHKMRGTWETPWGVDLALTWRYIDKVHVDDSTAESGDRVFDAMNYFDVAAAWKFATNYTLRAGVNNVVDKDPPVGGITSSVFGNGNTFPQVYDGLGRRVFLTLTAKF